MIAQPRRSVTRFFIPLIDVLILLLTIFLLMPFVSGPQANDPPEPVVKPPTAELSSDVKELQRELAEARARVERLQRERAALADRLSVRVLEIDKDTGGLYYFDPGRQEVRTQAEAQKLIDRQRWAAKGKDVFFLVLFPRELSPYPLQRQIDQYRQWFKDVPHGFDNPLAGF